MKRLSLLFAFILFGCAPWMIDKIDYASLYGPSSPKQRVLTQDQAKLYRQQRKVSFTRDVKPILDSRCVVCHGCYDAPCQLKLGSIEGIDRGANKNPVYDFIRFKAAEPTRLFIDAKNTQEWRKKQFFPVLNERLDEPEINLEHSVLAKLLELKRVNPLPASGKLPNDYDLEFDRTLECPAIEEFPKYERVHPGWGMPYALPGLTPDQ
jgi:hypothetical protein